MPRLNVWRMVVPALFVASLLVHDAAADPQKRALLIGIDDYAAVTKLKGCVNDVEDMKRLLSSKYGFKAENITVLRNTGATRDGILRALTSLAGNTAGNDIVVIHYSGHGSRVRDSVPGDEIDGWDETIVPQDSRQANIFDITDDELNARLRAIAAKTPNVTVVLDSCHSGSATRGGAQARRVPDDTRIPPAPAQPAPATASESRTSEIIPIDVPYALIAGCRPMELSNEYDVNGQRRGALTYFLTSELRKAPQGTTFRDLRDRLLGDVTAMFPSQHPQIEGSRLDSEVFGDVDVPGAPYYVARTIATPIKVEGGAIDGLTTGSRLAVYPPQTKVFPADGAVAELELTQVNAYTSTARQIGSRQPPDAGRAIVTRATPQSFSLRVYIDDPNPSQALKQIRTKVTNESAMRLVTQPTAAHVIVRESGGSFRILHADLTERSPGVPTGQADAVKRVFKQLQQWRHWYGVAALENPNAVVPVRFSIRVNGNELPQGDAEVTHGDTATFAVTNTSQRPVYFALLDLSADGSVAPLYPRHGEEETLTPGQTWQEDFGLEAQPGASVSPGTFKLITGDQPIPVNSYLQDAIRTAVPREATEWATTQRSVRVRRSVRAVGFIIHDPKPAGEGTRAVRAGDTVGDCSQPAGCYELRPFGATTLVEAVPGGRGDTAMLGAMGNIWDEAYRLKQETGASAVEPSIDVDLSDWEQDDIPPSARSTGNDPPKPGAVVDDEWSLKHINAAKAWQMLQAPPGSRRDGEEGASVMIAHVDTGYRKHPETWNADETRSTVLPSKGYDFLDVDDDPTDDLDTTGALPNPGHGTKSGSVIASAKGAQYASPNGKHATGVAPGAHLIPIRVHRSVVHFNSTRLGRAIFEAAGPDRTRVKAPSQVISISMGGLPSWTLWKAVRYARDQGDVVVAAAGNNVGFVVWPARFRETVAVAATNVDCGVWKGSSHGDAVDIAAPGESVWHAEVDPAGGNIVDMGSGTTYATAAVAGIAALWLDQHRSEPLLRQLQKDGQVTDAFRSALRASAWIPPATSVPQNVTCLDRSAWNANETGAGIADAAKTLAQPLARPAAARALDGGRLPLFRSLFASTVPYEEIEDRYRRLLRVGPETSTESVSDLEAEIVQNYALNERVRQSLDAIAQDAPPSGDQLQAVRAALLQASISNRLRQALT